MKNLSILLFLTVAAGICSCTDDFLSLSPKTELTSSTFYKTEEHFEQALTACYTRLRTIAYHGIYMDEMRSDNTFYTYYAGDRGPYTTMEVFALFLDDEENTLHTGARYDENYNGIARCNSILSRINDIEFYSESVKNRIEAETRFLRAFFYYDLVQHFGGVPLQLVEITSEEGAFLPRATVSEVYGQIMEDLTVAIPYLSVASSFPQSGRASKGSAKMLLAYVYMSKPDSDFAKAEAELVDISNMNYELLNDYIEIFNPNNKNHKESIFEIQYLEGDAGQQNDYVWRLIPKMDNTMELLGVESTNYAYTSGGWNVPTRELVDSYESGDLRLNASIAIAEGVKTGDNFAFGALHADVRNFTPTDGKDWYYFVRKYFHPPYAKAFNAGENWPVFRYADALLLLAECLVEQNRPSEALPYLNMVRRRAGLNNLAVATKDNIAEERRHELAFENHRWMDLIRTGKAIEVMTAFGETMKSLHGWILPSAFNVTTERFVYPIPLRELQINSNLTQNQGY